MCAAMPLTLAMTAPLLIVTHKVSNHHLRHEWQLSKLIEKYGNFCGTKTLCYEFFLVTFCRWKKQDWRGWNWVCNKTIVS
jgi:hypothetical protein